MKENKGRIEIENNPKNYKLHLIVFVSVIIILFVLAWVLPIYFNVRENLVEKYLMSGFAGFLILFLFWIRK